MTPKTFRAKSIQAAVKKIKQELGADAMILSTRRVSPGINDPYNQDLFEVTAIAQGKRSVTVKPRRDATPSIRNRYLDVSVEDDVHHKNSSSGISRLVDGKEETGYVHESQALRFVDPEGKNGSLQSELAGIKDLLYLLNETKGFSDFFQNYPECLTVYRKLIAIGISEKQVQRFMMKACRLVHDERPTPQMITRHVLKHILSTICVVDPFCLPNDDDSAALDLKLRRQQLAAFIGPTGAGKTTTIAKLAADLGLKQKRSVGLISIDSYRVGALEQLKVYSSIMGLPCLPAFSEKDLAIAVRKMRHKDVLLIDTAGHGHLDEKRMSELARLMGRDMDISSHLVLSVTTNREDMKDAAKHFNLLKPHTFIFTKIDETRRRGVMLDQIESLKLPISFITNGQRVPEDIIKASPKKILDLILKQEI
jgi:flagellar biosynthesis protein FlhF